MTHCAQSNYNVCLPLLILNKGSAHTLLGRAHTSLDNAHTSLEPITKFLNNKSTYNNSDNNFEKTRWMHKFKIEVAVLNILGFFS